MSLVLDLVMYWQAGQNKMRRKKYCNYLVEFVTACGTIVERDDLSQIKLWFCFININSYFLYLKKLSSYLLHKFGYSLSYEKKYRKKWPTSVDALIIQ